MTRQVNENARSPADMGGNLGHQGGIVPAPELMICVAMARPPNVHSCTIADVACIHTYALTGRFTRGQSDQRQGECPSDGPAYASVSIGLRCARDLP